MVEGELVDRVIEDSRRFLHRLDANKFVVDAAFWLLDPESEFWHLFIAAPAVRSEGPRASYTAARYALEQAKVTAIPLSQIKMVAPDLSIVLLLRSAIRVEGIGTVRLSQSTINGVYIRDAVLLRTARLDANDNDRYVQKRDDGQWEVVREDGRASVVTRTQREAIDRGREIVHNAGGGELVIKGQDGTIRSKDTIAPGNGPRRSNA